jgi:hypothetical protein
VSSVEVINRLAAVRRYSTLTGSQAMELSFTLAQLGSSLISTRFVTVD